MDAVDTLAGSMLVCIMLAAILYGVNTTQAFLYYQRYPNDRFALKTAVALVWALDTVHVVFCLDYIYIYVIEHFGDQGFMLGIDWTAGVTVVLQLLIAALVHGFYVRRLWIVSGKNRFLTALVGSLASIRCVFGLISAGLSYRYTRWSAFHSHELSLATSAVTLSSAVLADALILFCLVYFLARSRLALDPYEGYVRVFSVYVANPGVFTSMFSVAALVMFLAYPSGYIWLGLVELQSKFYVYAFLTGLNDRARIWDGSTRSSRVSTWGFWRPTIPTGRATDTRIGTHIAETQIDEEMGIDSYELSPSGAQESTTACTGSDRLRRSCSK